MAHKGAGTEGGMIALENVDNSLVHLKGYTIGD